MVAGVAVAVIVAFDPRDGYVGGRPKYLVLLAGAAVALGLLVALGAGHVWRRNPLRWPVAAFVVWTAVSAIASPHPRTAVFGYAGSYDGLTTTVAVAVLFFATVAAFRPVEVTGALRAISLGAGAAVLLFGVAQVIDRLVSPDTGWDWARPAISPHTIGSTLGNPNHLAGLLAMFIPIGVVLAARASGRQRRVIVAGLAVALAEVAITASRGGWLALVAGMLVLGVLLRAQLRPYRAQVVLLTMVAVALVAVTVVLFGAAGVTKIRPDALARIGPGTTVRQRMEIWAIAWRVWTDHPIAGVGPDVFTEVFPAYVTFAFSMRYGTFTVANGAHNLFVNTLATTGAVGLVALLVVLGTAARRLADAWRGLTADAGDRLLLAGIAAALAAHVVQACLNTQTLPLTLLFWLLLGLGLALISNVGEGRS